MKRLVINAILFLAVLYSYAQGLTVSAPGNISVGENFRLSYVINTQDAGDIHIGNIPDAFEIITGPYRSSQSSYQVVNGHASSSSSTTFTFILCAMKNGTYTIPAASVVANGRRHTSRPIHIKVTGKSATTHGAPRMHGSQDDQPGMRAAGSEIKGSDLFIKVSASKSKVYEQEPVVLTYKVYTLVDLIELNGKMPDLTGFHTLEVPLPRQKSFFIENHNGRQYRCVTWSQYIMYPQMHGKLKVPSIVFKASVRQQTRNIDMMEALFNGGSAYVEVKRDITAPGLAFDVLPLPTKPANYSGGVGVFNISAQLTQKEIRSNEPFTLRVVVSGRGNMKLLKKPVVNFPKDFDKYDPKVTDKTKITANGLEGNMIYDYTVVPRSQGKYTIPAIEFTYFDVNTHQYKTVKTQQFDITVTKGSGDTSSMSEYDGDVKDKDIRKIKEGTTTLHNADTMFYGSAVYWTLMIIIIIVSIALLLMMRKYIAVGKDTVGQRTRRANHVALKRLRVANDAMLRGNKTTFYDEVLKTLWGYAGEKFNLAGDELNRGSIEKMLTENGVADDVVQRYLQLIDTCEMEHYSPTSSAANMNTIFEDAMNIITKIENTLKPKRKRAAHAMVLTLLLMLVAVPTFAITKENADTEYRKGNYQQAIKDYNEILKGGESAEIYYNLGNAYYRMDNITSAILSYEKAHKLAPSDGDIAFNLQLARSKTIDKIVSEPQMFLVQWYNSLVNLQSADAWAWCSIVSLVLAFALFAMYLFSVRIGLRKAGFFGSLFFVVVVVLGNVCAWQQKEMAADNSGAVVVVSSLQLKTTPDEKSENAGVIHEGTRVEIIDDTMTDWKCVRLGDNREGWLHARQIERI